MTNTSFFSLVKETREMNIRNDLGLEFEEILNWCVAYHCVQRLPIITMKDNAMNGLRKEVSGSSWIFGQELGHSIGLYVKPSKISIFFLWSIYSLNNGCF